VADGELRLVRGEQLVKPGWADRFHDAMKRKKVERKRSPLSRQVRGAPLTVGGTCGLASWTTSRRAFTVPRPRSSWKDPQRYRNLVAVEDGEVIGFAEGTLRHRLRKRLRAHRRWSSWKASALRPGARRQGSSPAAGRCDS